MSQLRAGGIQCALRVSTRTGKSLSFGVFRAHPACLFPFADSALHSSITHQPEYSNVQLGPPRETCTWG